MADENLPAGSASRASRSGYGIGRALHDVPRRLRALFCRLMKRAGLCPGGPENNTSPSGAFRRLNRVVPGLLSFLFVWLLLVPWTPESFTGPVDGSSAWSIDTSYMAGLHEAFARRMDFSLLPCTKGPWGFLYDGYHPATFAWQVTAWSFLAAAFWLGCSVGIGVRNSWARALTIVFLAWLTCSAADSPDVRFYVLIGLLVACYFYAPQHVNPAAKDSTTIVLTAAVALIGLVKFSFFIAGLGAVLIISADESAWRRVWPRHLLAYAGALAIFWLLARQPPESLFPFLRNSWELTSGYGAMALSLANETGDVLQFLAAAGFLAVRAGRFAWGAWRFRGLPAMLATTFLLFVLFKAGHVRDDPAHHIEVTFPLLFLTIFLSLQFRQGERGAWRALACLTIAATAGLAWEDSSRYNYCGLPVAFWRSAATIPANARSLASTLAGDGRARRQYDREMARVRAARPLPPMSGTVDVYPSDILIVLANGLHWQPRPVMQSYMACTPALAALNAENLRSPRAPDRVLFSIQPLDDRFPSLDDGPSWPELWTRYEVDAVHSDWLWLKRSDHPRPYRMELLGDAVTTWGEPVQIPGAGDKAVWASIEIKPSPTGSAANLLFKSPQPYLRVFSVDGDTLAGALPWRMARSGFMLSPLIGDARAFADFASNEWRQRLKRHFASRLVVETRPPGDGRIYYDPKIVVHFSTMDFERSGAAPGGE